MTLREIKQRVNKKPTFKKILLHLMMHPMKARPRFWLRLLQFFYIKKGRGAVIYRSVRKDIVPFNTFSMGDYSVVEDYSAVNNAVGDIIIGKRSRVGLSNIIIGPVRVGNDVHIGQHVVLSGLNHNYLDAENLISEQGVTPNEILIENDVCIGANSVIVAGVSIGEHAVIGAGSVVTKSIPSFCVAVGNPAKVIKRYDFDKKEWIRTV